MLHNFMVIASAVFSVAILRRPLRVHEWLGCFIVTTALILTGVPALTHPEEATANQGLHWLGIVLAILSTCVHALQNIWEERLFLKGKMSSVLAVGIEGATGIGLSIVVLPLIHLAGIENLSIGFYQLSISSQLRSGMFWYSISSFANNSTGVVVTKWTSGLLRWYEFRLNLRTPPNPTPSRMIYLFIQFIHVHETARRMDYRNDSGLESF
eukprot:Gregarina_sp_Poly_1__2188@NODE_1581_length_3795_cov_120_818938_g311_i2_p3_GENE_NODE_1581_length_3795_cov_120_818938_g311_i2NODE_1581_length_3795_cov_120_818938_g311_i2_p3_ORF_typecomplete_len211_score16_17CRTlike/PF08627_10/4_1e20SLC35F/PF06027_12/3_7e16Nuc_sug_transp/PF04142_15/9_7e13UAA/PF08449_11/4_1e08TPT/PF03151_16/2e06PUNUT/PF16913_5/4_3e05PUNUT/PF16913_5/4_4e02Mg_trans_NIPA/PF05653_14/0_0013NDUF_C2/PF06374_11/2_4e02NDUF_C2/PF06374_11/0_0857TMRDISM_7TM/PF07695_11/0_00677TMRDISM_7TM/PF07695